jgi:hypothetical protein
LAKRNPNACTNTRFGVPICSLPDVLRRPPMHTGRKSWELLLRNRTWDARRATVGPHLAAISGKLRSLRVSAIGVCSTAPTGRGILPSWSCEFDSCHPLHGESARRRLLIDADSNSTSALLRTSGDLRATARWFRTHTRSDRACPTRGGRIESVPQVTKSFIVSVLSPGAPASPRQPWTPHRPTSQLPSAHRTSQDEATGRRLREQIIIAASQSACILLPNRVPERRLGTRQYRHFNQLSPNSSYQDKVRSKNAYI